MVSHPLVDSAPRHRPWRGRLPALSEAVKLPARAFVPPARRGDRTTASQAAPGAAGRLLLPGTRWPNRVPPLSQKWDGARRFYLLDAWGTGGSCSSRALLTGFLLSSNHSLGQGNAFFSFPFCSASIARPRRKRKVLLPNVS